MDLQKYLLKHPKTHLIFDLDETLAKLNIDWSSYRKGIWDTVATFDKPLTEDVPFEPWMSLTLINRAVEKHGETAKKTISSFITTYETSHYHGYTPNIPLLSFIQENKDVYSFFIWTNNSTAVIQDFLVKEHLCNMFKKMVSRDIVSYVKPDPDGFSYIRDPRVPLSQYLFIGDNPRTDQLAAQNAGIDFFLIDHAF